MDKRKILVLSLLGLGMLGIPVFSQNELTVTNMSVYTVSVLNFTYNGTYGANVFAVSHYTYNNTPYILTVLGTNYPISVDLFNITGGLVTSENISSLVQNLMNQGYSLGNIFIYEYNDTAYIDIPFYQYSGSFYTGSYTDLYLYQMTVNGNNISSPQLVSNATISGSLSNIYFIDTPENTQYIITNNGIYSTNGTALLSLAAPISSLYLHILPTESNIYMDYSYYIYNNNFLFSLADINLNTGQLYIFYNNTNTLYGFTVFVSTYYPNDSAITVDTPDWNDLIVNTTMYSLSSTFCTTFGGEPAYIYNNYLGMFSNYPNVTITFNIFNITNNTLYCFPYSYNGSIEFIIPNLSMSIPITSVIYSVTPIYYNGSDIFLLVPLIDSGYLFDFNLTNITVGYNNFTGSCTADNYLITCSNNGETDIYVVSGQPLTPTPTQISYTVPTQVPTCYPQQFNYTNFTAYLLHIFNVTFDQLSLSGVNVYGIYPYTYNNSPYILAIVGTEYPQLVSLFNITGGLIATENISNLTINLTNQGYSLNNIFIYEYNDTAYISLPFSTTNNYLLYEMTVTGNNISSPQLVSSIYNPDMPFSDIYYEEIDSYTIYAGDFMNPSTGGVETILNITQGNIPVISINSGYSQPFNPMYIFYNPVQTVETKDYVYIIFGTGQSTNGNRYLFVFAINKATGQIYNVLNGTMVNIVAYVIQSDYYNDVVSIPIKNTAGQYVSILIVGNLSTTAPGYTLVNGNYVIGYSKILNYNNTQYTCINMNIYNYTVQGDNIILNQVNQSSILDTFGSNISSLSGIGLSEAGYIPIAFSSDDNIYSLLYLQNYSFILDPSYYQFESYGLYNELGIFPSSNQYSYIQILPVYNYQFFNWSASSFTTISQSCSQEGYLIMCTTSNSDTSTTETDIYVLSALNLTPTPVNMLLTTPTAPLIPTVPTQTSAPPSPSTTTSPTTTTTTAVAVPSPAPSSTVYVPSGYTTTGQTSVAIPMYIIFVTTGLGIIGVALYYVYRKYH